jgi:hypothetical protein
MPDNKSPLNPPDSPPVGPVIPEGLATKVGKYGSVAAFVVAVVVGVFDVQLEAETKEFIIYGVGLLLTTMLGRYAQSAALYRDTPAPVEDIYASDVLGDLPDDDELSTVYDGEAPADEVPEGAVGDKPGEDV